MRWLAFVARVLGVLAPLPGKSYLEQRMKQTLARKNEKAVKTVG